MPKWGLRVRPTLLFLFSGMAAAAVGDSPKILATDTFFQVSDGVFMAPKGWLMRRDASMMIFQSPEGDTRLTVAAEPGVDAATAVQRAWMQFSPAAHREPKLVTPSLAQRGWTEHQFFEYELPPNEQADVSADAYRSGNHWIVLLTDGKLATTEKRSSQIDLLRDSLRASSYHPESFAGRTANSFTPERVEVLRRFVSEGMDQLGIPGASLAIVNHGKVVFEGGFGVRKLGFPAPVDENTRFLAASLTKGLTTLLLARLADEGKLSWDEPAVQALPMFRLGDSATTRQILVKHLVCACTGLPRQDLEWEFEYKNATATSMLKLLGSMQPTSRPGELFQYSNLMAAAAGYVAGYVSDPKIAIAASYARAMQEMIFDPLQMHDTTFDFEAAHRGNYASPHADDIDGHPAVGEMASNYSIVPLAPAGGAWTTAHDLIRYVQLELGNGKLPDGTQLVSENNLLARRKPQVRRGADQSYGMGLTIDTTWGVTVLRHGGSMDGYKSELFFIPEADAGVVLLMNSDNGDFLEQPLLRRVLEVLYDGKPEAESDLRSRVQAHRSSIEQTRRELSVPPDETASKQLAAAYQNSALGRIDVLRDGGGVVFDFGEWKSGVASKKNSDGTVSFVTVDPTVSGFEFVVGTRDGEKVLVLRDSQHEYVFRPAAG